MAVDVPASPGNFAVRWDMRRFNTEWRKGEPGLPGSGPVKVKVNNISYLALIVSQRAFFEDPGIYDGPGSVTPGGTYVLSGWSLGSQPGTVLLQGAFNKGPYVMQIVSWTDDAIGFQVPAICGEPDAAGATLAARTPSGKTATSPVQFVARRDTRTLTQDDMTLDCSQAGWRNRCNDAGSGPVGFGSNLADHKEWAVTGQHQAGFFAGASGVDGFSVPLTNGWKIASAYVEHEGNDPTDNVFEICFIPCDITTSFTDDTVSVAWRVDHALQWVGYNGVATVSGPCGLPYR